MPCQWHSQIVYTASIVEIADDAFCWPISVPPCATISVVVFASNQRSMQLEPKWLSSAIIIASAGWQFPFYKLWPRSIESTARSDLFARAADRARRAACDGRRTEHERTPWMQAMANPNDMDSFYFNIIVKAKRRIICCDRDRAQAGTNGMDVDRAVE